jgi:cystathionine gamma-lyase/cystathionine beta-lyase/cystathionine gamma-lyase/homocysteine desulfhydrase
MGIATDAIHAGVQPDPTTGAIMTPIYQTSTYAYEGLGRDKGYDYARSINPTRSALEENLRALEEGCAAYAFASGMAAITAVMSLLKSGDHVVVSDNVYGGTYRLFARVLEDFGLSFTYVDTSSLDRLEKAIRPNTKMVYVETPTNPIMTLTDIAEAARLCRSRNLISAIDNTFLTPCLQRPLRLGADIVVHSTTKYLNGHSDSVGGAAILARPGPAGARRAHQVRPEFRRRHSRPLRLLAGPPGHQDAAPSDAGARGQRARGGPLPRGASNG